MPNLWPRGTSHGQRTTQINDFDRERETTNVRERRRARFPGKNPSGRPKPPKPHVPCLNPAWTLFGSLKGILGPQAYIGLSLISECRQLGSKNAAALGLIASIAHIRKQRAIICSILRVAIGFTTASAFVRTNALRQSVLSVSRLVRNKRRTATTMATWDATRERSLKAASNNKGDVLYWMARDQHGRGVNYTSCLHAIDATRRHAGAPRTTGLSSEPPH